MIPKFVPETEAGLAEGVKNGKTVAHRELDSSTHAFDFTSSRGFCRFPLGLQHSYQSSAVHTR